MQDYPSSQPEPVTRIPLNDTALQYIAQSAAEQESIPTFPPNTDEELKVESSSQSLVKEEESSSQPQSQNLSGSQILQALLNQPQVLTSSQMTQALLREESSQPLYQSFSDSLSTDNDSTPKAT